jgi:hypothetical protein
LEDAAKVPEEVQRHRGLNRVCLCLWPRFDYNCELNRLRGSFVIVGEVFKVTTHVDQGLTRVNVLDSVININEVN